MRLLVTGFPPFSGCPVNPTQALIERIQADGLDLPGVSVRAELLPVEYAAVESASERCLRDFIPDVWLAFGTGRQSLPLQLEAVGHNRDDSSRPDNAGELRSGSEVVPGGLEQLSSPLQLEEIQICLSGQGFPTAISQHAGGYLCNHLQYYVLHRLQQTGQNCRFLFTHVAPADAEYPLENLWQAARTMAGWFQNRHTGG